LDKLPSFDAGEAPRRSTSSLDTNLDGVPPTGPSHPANARGMVGKAIAGLGFALFLVGLVWFAHFSYSLRAYTSSVLTMIAGALLAITGSGRWGDILLSIREYFRRRLR
jgi:hypothetical protein